MNALLAELNRLGVSHVTTEDVFTFAENVFHNFGFLFQTEESGPRKIDLVSSLFEHLTVECVNDILDACSHESPDGNGTSAAPPHAQKEQGGGSSGGGRTGHV
ncbi:Cy126 [Cynomolgus cytomegalovirus]|uniref:Protein UL91 n=1 Tax=Cynomolgus macaque cytomegalovirus strain Mauritius TaxID=1690255 RepID=A0A0K1H063_9BETA|nr:Cy126 [Cynomolgus cytomegalovirus]AKT72857.1 protein UL91 [Cynomolgus macaque cytomegalovirus strain Mauritius]AXG21828.1 protein UL91 [synthetic construct]APT39293.1 Cy126 [Cynomolgus cytomegalovirus]APT39482.1 Cy126 [Cynomolgus cytomegalovirus]APT39677.1 Cy126 [Cynomolgus cytomegalovirus]